MHNYSRQVTITQNHAGPLAMTSKVKSELDIRVRQKKKKSENSREHQLQNLRKEEVLLSESSEEALPRTPNILALRGNPNSVIP